MIVHDICRQILRYQREHDGEAPKEHWIDRVTWDRACDETDAVMSKYIYFEPRRYLPNPAIMGVPVRIWDDPA